MLLNFDIMFLLDVEFPMIFMNCSGWQILILQISSSLLLQKEKRNSQYFDHPEQLDEFSPLIESSPALINTD